MKKNITHAARGLYFSFCLSACTNSATVTEKDIRKIESQLKLPPGADQLYAYDRVYVISKEGHLFARYVLKGLINFDKVSQDCRSFYNDKQDCEIYSDMKKNLDKRGWFIAKSDDYAPAVNDGGCMTVNFEYDVKRHVFIQNPTCGDRR